MDTTTPASAYCLENVSDDDLHLRARRLVGRSNQLLAALLAHLAEVEARGLHRERTCASLYTYCIYELRLSEDEAFRRARAARIARQFPILFEKVAGGEIHLTGILMLGPHLTEENHIEVLALAKHRTKKEIERLVRRLNPLPDVRALVEPLGPAPHAIAGNPTWSQVVEAHSPVVRELPPGNRPRDWIDAEATDDASLGEAAAAVSDDTAVGNADERADNTDTGPEPTLAPPQRYKVQFTATQEYVDLLETAKGLLAHAIPSCSIEEVHLRAMRALVSELKKRKAGATTTSRAKAPVGKSAEEVRVVGEHRVVGGSANPRQRGTDPPVHPRQRGTNATANPRQRQRGRHIPRAVRRAVWERDGERCTYVDGIGRRCRETRGLELDHAQPYARGGTATVANLRLRCRAHNALTAEKDFGRDFMAQKRGSARVEADVL